MRFIVNLFAFWVLDWRGLLALSSAFATVASGFVMPITFFPTSATRPVHRAAVGVDDPDADRRLHRPPHRRDARERARAPGRLGDRPARDRAAHPARGRRSGSSCRVADVRVRDASTRGVGSSARASAAQLQYRMSFALNTTAAFFLTFIDFVVVLVLFSHFQALDGWTLQEVALLYGLSGVGIAIADMLIGHIDVIHVDIRSGQFDVVLLRPGRDAAPGDVVRPRAAADRPASRRRSIVAGLRARRSRHRVGPRCACCCSPSMRRVAARRSSARRSSLGACLTFWTVGSGEVSAAFTYGGDTMTSYPLNIFGTVAAPPARVRDPARVRRLLPGPLPPRQARPARLPGRASSSSRPSLRRVRGVAPGSSGDVPCATTGAPARDPRRAASRSRSTSGARTAGTMRRTRERVVPRSTTSRSPSTARRDGRLRRAERRRASPRRSRC